MKQCPKCGNSYTDNTLSYCLTDGSVLVDGGEQPTVIRSPDPNKTEQLPSGAGGTQRDAIRVTVPGTDAATSQSTYSQPKPRSRSVLLTIIVVAVLLGGLVVVAAVGILGAAYYLNSGNTNSTAFSSPTPSPSPLLTISPTPDDKKAQLENELEKLKKQLEDAGSADADDEITITQNDLGSFGKTATVNSPKDGFLALRNLPSTDIGQRIAKIPHGAEITLMFCAEQSVTIGSRTGHWCMTTYEGQAGWVFDVWLVKN